jgi:hypothetical protein
MIEQHLGVWVTRQEVPGHVGQIEGGAFLARDSGQVVALRDDENIILVAGCKTPGVAQFFGDIQAGAFPVLAGTIARPFGSRSYFPFGSLAQQGIAHRLRLKIEAVSERACNLFDNLGNSVAEAVARVEGADMIPRFPCRHADRFARFVAHSYASAIEHDQRRKDRPQPADTSLAHRICSEVTTMALAIWSAALANRRKSGDN